MNIHQASVPITIDGVMDSEWPDVDGIPLNKENVNAIKSGFLPNEAVNSKTYFTWDETYLYVFQDVNDPSPMRNNASGDGIWNGDSFEVFFGSEEVDKVGAYLPTDRQLILSAGKNYDDTFNYWWFKSDKQYNVKLFVREKIGESGYVMEAAIPWESINLTNPEIGTEIRFDFGMSEGEGQGRISQYMWNCMVETNHLNRDNWGKAILVSGIDSTKEDMDVAITEKEDDSRHRVLNIPKADCVINVDGIRDGSWPAGQNIIIGSNELVMGNPAHPVEAEISFAWDQVNLYIYAHYKDVTPMVNGFNGADIWNGDGLELFFGPNELKTTGKLLPDDRQIIISGGLAEDGSVKYHFYNTEEQGTITAVVKNDDDGMGYVIEAAIPWDIVNITNPAKNTTFRFDLAVDGSDVRERNQQATWNSKLDNLNAYRDNWGLAILTDN